MEKWDRNDWQGKRKDQVDYVHTVTFYTIIIGFVVGFVCGILYLCNVL